MNLDEISKVELREQLRFCYLKILSIDLGEIRLTNSGEYEFIEYEWSINIRKILGQLYEPSCIYKMAEKILTSN